MRRIMLAVLITATFTATFTASTAAQQQQEQKPVQQQDTAVYAGVLAGRAAAAERGSGGSFWGGFFGGMMPPWGNLISYYVQGPAHLSAGQVAELSTHNSAYKLGFQTGFDERSKAMKRSAALKGGLISTLILSAMVAAALASCGC